MGCRGLASGARSHKEKLNLITKIVNVEKYVVSEDARHGEKHVLDLLESIMRHPGHVKEELRPISFKKVENQRNQGSNLLD